MSCIIMLYKSVEFPIWQLILCAESPSAIPLPWSSTPGKLPDWYESRGIESVKWINNVVLPKQRAKIKIIKNGL